MQINDLTTEIVKEQTLSKYTKKKKSLPLKAFFLKTLY